MKSTAKLTGMNGHTLRGALAEVASVEPLIPFPTRDDTPLRKDALKRTYLECLGKVGTRSETLRHAMVSLLKLQVPWQQLLRWADAAGHRGRTVTKLLSQILLDLGIRRRQPGAGPKPPPEAFLIEADVRQRYGELALKYLRAACRVAKARDEGETSTPRLLNPARDNS